MAPCHLSNKVKTLNATNVYHRRRHVSSCYRSKFYRLNRTRNCGNCRTAICVRFHCTCSIHSGRSAHRLESTHRVLTHYPRVSTAPGYYKRKGHYSCYRPCFTCHIGTICARELRESLINDRTLIRITLASGNRRLQLISTRASTFPPPPFHPLPPLYASISQYNFNGK